MKPSGTPVSQGKSFTDLLVEIRLTVYDLTRIDRTEYLQVKLPGESQHAEAMNEY